MMSRHRCCKLAVSPCSTAFRMALIMEAVTLRFDFYFISMFHRSQLRECILFSHGNHGLVAERVMQPLLPPKIVKPCFKPWSSAVWICAVKWSFESHHCWRLADISILTTSAIWLGMHENVIKHTFSHQTGVARQVNQRHWVTTQVVWHLYSQGSQTGQSPQRTRALNWAYFTRLPVAVLDEAWQSMDGLSTSDTSAKNTPASSMACKACSVFSISTDNDFSHRIAFAFWAALMRIRGGH